MIEDIQIINDHRELNKFLEEERKKNVSLLRGRYSLSQEDAEDIYQDSCMALYRNIQDGKLSTLTSRLTTYFTQICVNLTLKKIRDSKRIVSLTDRQYDSDKIDELLGLTQDTEFTEKQIQMLHRILSMLPPPCDKILWHYYGEERSMADIAIIINFKDASTVKAKKWQCVKCLDKVVTAKLKTAFYEQSGL